jgi:hypothetical protein
MNGGIPIVHATEQLVMNKICSFAIIATIHYKEKSKQRQLILASGGGFKLPLLRLRRFFKRRSFRRR